MDDPDSDDPRRPTEAELRRHRRAVPGGTPVVDLVRGPDPEPDLVPWPAVADPGDAEALRRAGRDPTEPAMPAEITALLKRLRRELREEFASLRDGTAAKRLDAIEDRQGSLERDFEPHKRFGKYVAGIAGAALLGLGLFLYHRGADEQRIADDVKAALEKANRCETKIDQLLTPTKEPRP